MFSILCHFDSLVVSLVVSHAWDEDVSLFFFFSPEDQSHWLIWLTIYSVLLLRLLQESDFCWLGSYSLKSHVLWTFLLLLRKLGKFLIKFWLESLYLLSWRFASPNHLETLYSSVTTRRRKWSWTRYSTQQHMQFLHQETEGVLFLSNSCRLLLQSTKKMVTTEAWVPLLHSLSLSLPVIVVSVFSKK